MDVAQQTGNQQATLWNGHAGRAWVETQARLDQLFEPFKDLLVETVSRAQRRQVLDVGCGAGSTTLAVAAMLGSHGVCTGIDISEPMLNAAKARAERDGIAARFLQDDAQVHPFETASFDMIISRFGVMFFNDPIQAFANLRRAAAEDAEVRLITWRSPEENPFMTTAERAAATLLPNLPIRRPDEPGQFGFANRRRVHEILEESGWTGIEIHPIDVACTLPESDLVTYLTRLGPVGVMLQEADDQTRAQVIETARPAFDPYVHGRDVHFNAACWMVSARA